MIERGSAYAVMDFTRTGVKEQDMNGQAYSRTANRTSTETPFQ